jgi:predicted DCC family thiol-disulfide oxidoreductase YuxK
MNADTSGNAAEQVPNQAASVVSRPLLLFDGDCGFCRYWVARLRSVTRGRVDFAPAQEQAARFPQIPSEAWKRSVQLITTDGNVYRGAEAVFRLLAYAPEERWQLAIYHRLPGVRLLSEWGYRQVEAHRDFCFKLTRFALGRIPEPSSFYLSRWVFLRLLGLIYVISFLSLRAQILGLLGARGILPASDFLRAVQANFGSAGYRLFPTLAWFGAGDASLKLLCTAGAVSALLVVVGVASGPALVVCWAVYLSIVTVGRDFLSFQWDILLLESGFLAIFFASWRPLESPWGAGSLRPPRTVLWLLRWLLFRLMFLSGSVKLLSGDPAWRKLTALEYHYWTQPIPTPVAWYAAQLPDWFQKISVVGVFAVELGIPFLVFAPRRIRGMGALSMIAFQCMIALTGNYAFFNLLAITLCLLLLDDAFWRRLLPKRLTERIGPSDSPASPRLSGRIVRAALAVIVLVISASEMLNTFNESTAVPLLAERLVEMQQPFYLANSYGLFAVMTTSRLEIVIEGSNDGETWLPYEFKYKPGALARRPPWVAPYQPRLDWQMWFAALGSYRETRWFVNFLVRLLQGSPEVIGLLAKNPFPAAPPRYIRAEGFEYRFTNFAGRCATGDWWQRETKGEYFPEASLHKE